MVIILKIEYIESYKLKIYFSDETLKIFDYKKLCLFIGTAAALESIEEFKKVKIAPNKRSIIWECGFDSCADWLRYFAEDELNEWKNIDESIDIKERIKLTNKQLV